MPAKTAELTKKRAIKRGFPSISSYVRFLIEEDEDLISQDELLELSKKASRDYKNGKLKKLKSLRDLITA